MKIGLTAENPLEWIAFRLNLAPKPLLETQINFIAARAIMAAAELGIFEVIGKSERTVDEIATTCKTHPHSTRQLLDCLVGVGYLHWRGGNYSLKRSYQKWLLQESECNLIGKLRFQRLEWDWTAKLEDYVRSNTPLEVHNQISAMDWKLYQEAMRDCAFNAAREVARKIPLPRGATKMLDIGGSHGLYSIALCQKCPALTSTVLELAGAVESASAIAKRYDNTGRVKHLAGNALTDDLGTDQYDLVMINNVVHHFSAKQNIALAAKVARALKPGGLYAIGDMIRAETPGEGGLLVSTTSLYFSLTSASGNWSCAEIASWQKAAGLQPTKTLTLVSIPGWKMVIARSMRSC